MIQISPLMSILWGFTGTFYCKIVREFCYCRNFHWVQFIVLIVSLLFITSLPHIVHAQTPAFPGAEGYGSYSKGGRGGDIIIVSNLNDSGPGSLRNAVEKDGPRTVIFETGGIIDLKSPLLFSDPYITIAGQTAPEPGITIRGERVKVQTNHVIIRFIRFRPGDYLKGESVDWGSLDALDIGLEDSDDVHDIILDHCSFSWAMDENIGIWHHSNNITIQNSIISEGLHFPKMHPKTGKGLLIGLFSNRISILKNLFAHNYERNPFMNANGHLDFRNNVIYNAGVRVMRFNNGRGLLQTVNIVNNVMIHGPETEYSNEIQIIRNSNDLYNGKIFIEGNQSDLNPQFNTDNWKMVVDQLTLDQFSSEARSSSEFPVENTNTLPTNELYNALKSDIGATLPVRDQIDERILHNLELKEGRYISRPEQLFGWPYFQETTQSFDPDNHWQKKYDIDLSNPAEAHADYNENGYTNLEEFLNRTHPYEDETEWKRMGNLNNEMFTSAFDITNQTTDEEAVVELQRNYPNPFNGTTNIPLSIKSTGFYKLDILNSIGQRVAELASSTLVPGEYQYIWNANGFPSGVYFVKLSSRGETTLQKIVLIK